MKYNLPRQTLAQARSLGRPIEAALDDFITAKVRGQSLSKLDKPCGYSRDGTPACQLHIDLRLRHYRLTPRSDPILVYQQLDDLLWIAGITRHPDIFFGSERRWCHAWHAAICWDGNEAHLQSLISEIGPLLD